MRGTLHLVAAEDVRWMLQLMTPRDEEAFGRSGEIVARALSAGDRGERAHGGNLDQGAGERLCHVRLESVHPSRHDCAHAVTAAAGRYGAFLELSADAS